MEGTKEKKSMMPKLKIWQWVAVAAFIIYIVWMGTINAEAMKLFGMDLEVKPGDDFNKDREISVGMRGVEVYRVQELLNANGEKLELNGIFDKAMQKALEKKTGLKKGTYNQIAAKVGIGSKPAANTGNDVEEG